MAILRTRHEQYDSHEPSIAVQRAGQPTLSFIALVIDTDMRQELLDKGRMIPCRLAHAAQPNSIHGRYRLYTWGGYCALYEYVHACCP
eukprot:scaffold2182_cov198-Amphora_coffeaeformis.AAC.3